MMNIVMGVIVIVVGMVLLPTIINITQNFETVSVPLQGALDLAPVAYILVLLIVAVVYFKGGTKA